MFNESRPIDPRHEAAAYLQAVMHQTNQGGRVDSENEQFRSIMNRLTLNQITPDEAIRLTNEICGSRQDYNT